MNIKSIIKISAAAVMCASISVSTAFAAAPPDVAGEPYEPAVSKLTDMGVITGDVDGLFHPDSNLTRAQFCVIIVKAMGAPAASVTGTPSQDVKRSGFPDLSGYGWADGYISYAVDKGVVNGYPDGSFKPGADVSVNELITMTLRAAGYGDASLGGVWPHNYVSKAGDVGALAGLPSPLPERAAKWMAAQLVYNVLPRVEAANPPEKSPAEGDVNPSEPPGGALTYVANGAFDGDITTFAGKSFASDVKVLRYGQRSDYSKDMKLSGKKGDYLEDTIYKYKLVTTPAWYELEGDKISMIVLPRDVGFTGRAYGVLKNVVSVTGGGGDVVDGFVTLTAGRAVTWAGSPGRTAPTGQEKLPVKEQYDNGQLFEFQLRNGEVTNVASVNRDRDSYGTPYDPTMTIELPQQTSATATFSAITSRAGGVVTVSDGGKGVVVDVKEKAAVYILGPDGEYYVGTLNSVREKALVRLYDVSDDKVSAADVVVIKEQ